ncbi:oligosaccharyl transferase glycoprotein complex beta subunit [Phialemonium atrogriseum]|uniref:Dolichyl-diphosphooligosaccharide--protein glycosyltransferase subunit WBP1 n=1 Tax=Phialemonium atrogriseum TaxID=1093897 RepID=A0AAJ0C375_9PEZI|nr:oligosaccharyl transferase glycoprotein complex beta subunit [Phialemonium atrogriseum]KAK1768677.1 oligosaccharyl transferase glycoprotein complex beta subunit [Phialemonium atrogriseum]
MKSLLCFFALLLASLVSAISSTGDRLLAIFDDIEEKASYSKFLGDLESRGFKITFETPKSESVSLFHLGERSYDHVIFFPTRSKGLGPNLTPNLLLQFINAKGNILLALSSSNPTPTSLVSLLAELDIQLPADRTGLVVDHFNYDSASASDLHDVLVLPPPGPIRPDVKDFFGGASASSGALLAFPRGVGATLGSGPLLTPVVRAPATAYSYNPKEQGEALDEVFAAGEQLSLVSAVQARNSARLALVGSAEMLQDKWFDAKVRRAGDKADSPTGNREFAKTVAGWAFKEIGVLKVNWVEHRLDEDAAETNPKIYRIKNDVTYTISLSEWSWDKWTAFNVPAHDALQLEFSMLSPFHRVPLVADASRSDPKAGAAAYSASLRLPDQHGIFNFVVNYKRPFLTAVEEKHTVSVRHMAHDEWPRSYAISGAWPWLAGIGATVAGWLAFVAVWMFSKPVAGQRGSKKTQ